MWKQETNARFFKDWKRVTVKLEVCKRENNALEIIEVVLSAET